MSRLSNDYVATQTKKGFHIAFHDSVRAPLDVTLSDFQEFANKYSREVTAGKTPELSNEEEVLLSLWQMVLIPEDTIH